MSANRSELAAIPRDFDERNLPNPAWCGVPYSPFDGAALYTIVKNFVYRAVNDRAVVVFEGHAKRNYLRVRDVAHAFLHALDNFERMKNEPYNVGLSDANLSKLELCAEIQKHLPKFVYLEAPVGEDPDKRDYIVSNAKIDRTGFKPAYSLEMGIRELIKGYTILRNSRYANMS